MPYDASEAPLDDRRQTRRVRARSFWVAIGVGLALSAVFAGGLVLTQTEWGRSQVLAFALRSIGGRVNGELTVDRVEGGLFAGARVYGLQLNDHDGAPLAVIDSALVRYRLATLLGGDVVITRLVVFDGSINIFRMPDDTIWNYQEVLRDPTPDPRDTGPPGATLIERLELYSTEIVVRTPYRPDPELSLREQQRQLREVLGDTARWMIEEVPGGYLRTTHVGVGRADLAELFIGPDERGGIYLEVNDAVADIRLWRDPPLEIRGGEAALHLREGVINYRVPRFALPNSRGESVGRIDLTGERPFYDVVFTTPAFVLADIRWLYPWLPDEPAAGQGSMRLWYEDRPNDALVLLHDLILEMPGTRITGQFGLLTGGAPRFVDVDLEADPLDADEVERLFPGDLPVEGLEIGDAVIRAVDGS